MQQPSRVADLGLLPFIKNSEDYKGVTLKTLRVLNFIDDYEKALSEDSELSKKCALKAILYECRNEEPYRDVADYLSKKFIGKDYISLFNMEMNGMI